MKKRSPFRIVEGRLQQYLPFTVLKLLLRGWPPFIILVATVLTVYGIETSQFLPPGIDYLAIVATVLTVYGIETYKNNIVTINRNNIVVATVLTVYGIETYNTRWFNKRLFYCRLQQHLPFTVLKHGLDVEFKRPNQY